MLAYLHGALTYKSPTLVHLDINGVGYEVLISLQTYSMIEQLDKVKLHVTEILREDSATIYGFFETDEKIMFNHLISVSGIGGNTARIILSSLAVHEVRAAILNDHHMVFNKVKGIGPKTAKRVILELKEKMVKLSLTGATTETVSSQPNANQEAKSALSALGFSGAQIDKAFSKIGSGDAGVEDLIKQALKILS